MNDVFQLLFIVYCTFKSCFVSAFKFVLHILPSTLSYPEKKAVLLLKIAVEIIFFYILFDERNSFYGYFPKFFGTIHSKPSDKLAQFQLAVGSKKAGTLACAAATKNIFFNENYFQAFVHQCMSSTYTTHSATNHKHIA